MTRTITAASAGMNVEPEVITTLPATVRRGRRVDLGLVVLIAAIAFLARLVPVLRGGGLSGLNSYDGSVYYAAAAGLANGLLPYRDYLLLHPPGVVLALLPFAAVGRLIGHSSAATVATLAWMALGALNAVLASRILRPQGHLPALVAGLAYAVFIPAIRVEGATTLEALTTFCLLAAVLLITRAATGGSLAESRHPRLLTGARPFAVAGVLLGVASGVKIWEVVLVAAVVLGCLIGSGRRPAFATLAGAGIGVTAVCLPFFVGAPGTMWRMVVVDQVGRRRMPTPWLDKLTDMVGLTELDPGGVLLTATIAGLAFAIVLALRSPVGRLGVLLLGVSWVVLWATPSWSIDYASLGAAPLAMVLGSAVAAFRTVRLRVVAAVLVVVALAVTATLSLADLKRGEKFPAAALRAGLESTPGCVTTDFPTALIETGVLQRNFDRGCPLVADLGGYSYDLRPGADLQVGRVLNQQWQQFALDYLRSGDATMLMRFRDVPTYSRPTWAIIKAWPQSVKVGEFSVRHPTPPAGPHR